MDKQPLIVLTGPTAVGKTKLSIALAKAVGGEIISADSMQVYRGMDIGSAKITNAQMQGIKHYLIDVLNPDEEFNVVKFKDMAKDALAKIYAKGKIPIVTGGTGFYIQALLYDIDFKENPDGAKIRQRLEQEEREKGPGHLHLLLQKADPQAAKDIHANNIKRVIRALEYYYQTGARISDHNRQERAKESPYQFFYYVLNTDRTILYERIDQRVDEMLEAGLVREVEALRQQGFHAGMVSMQGLGYKEMLRFLDGEITLAQAADQIKQGTRHFAKRQLTWFKREREVRWLYLPDFGNDMDRVLERMQTEIKNEIYTDGSRK